MNVAIDSSGMCVISDGEWMNAASLVAVGQRAELGDCTMTS